MKFFSWVLSFFMAFQPAPLPKIINPPSGRVNLQIWDDYKKIKSIIESVPHSKLRDLEIELVEPKHRSYVVRFPVEAKSHKATKKYKIFTENSRGVWVHELAHYFSYHYEGEGGPEEFICQVLSDYINGTLPETRKKYYEYNPI